jgi:hypothetical protein
MKIEMPEGALRIAVRSGAVKISQATGPIRS